MIFSWGLIADTVRSYTYRHNRDKFMQERIAWAMFFSWALIADTVRSYTHRYRRGKFMQERIACAMFFPAC